MTDINVSIRPSSLRKAEVPAALDISALLTMPISGYLTPPQISIAYNIPAGNGAGIKLGIIAPLGGGFLQSDLDASFADLIAAGLITSGTPAPIINQVLLDDRTGVFDINDAGSTENTVDIYCIATMVPAADITIYISDGFASAIDRAISDGCHIISISYAYTREPPYSTSLEDKFALAAAAKIAICVASGDTGSSFVGQSDVRIGYPGSSPAVINIGGTHLFLNNDNTRSYESDDNRDPAFGSSWGGGGGVSRYFSLPDWQAGLTYTPIINGVMGDPTPLTMRGVPDISAPMNGYLVYIGGILYSIGGTSLSAPFIAGVLARIQALTSIQRSSAEYNALFYANPAGFYDITVGTNNTLITDGYAGTESWDPVTGLGPPIGNLFYTVPDINSGPSLVFPKFNNGTRLTTGQIWPRTTSR